MSWPTVALGEICIVDWGNTSLTKSSYVAGGEYLAVSATGGDGRIDHWEHQALTPVISAIGAQCGKLFLPKEDFTAIKNTITLTPIDDKRSQEACCPIYLYHLLSSMQLPRRGAGQPFISKGDLEKFKIPLPPLEEQRRIAAILDKASSIVASQQRRTAILWQLEASLFSQMATDSASGLKDCMLKDLTADRDKINYGVVQPGNQFDGGVPLIRVGDLVSGGVDRSAIKCIDPAIEATYTRSRIVGNEILLSCVGSIGVVALVEPRDVGSNIARAVARFPVSQSVNRKWLAACLRSTTVQRYFINELRTVSQPTLNIKQIEETIIRLPPIELQNSFAIKLDAIEKLCKRSSFSEAQVSNLISAFQSKAFIGRP
jgi:type I restriction enzyme S subunit